MLAYVRILKLDGNLEFYKWHKEMNSKGSVRNGILYKYSRPTHRVPTPALTLVGEI